MSEINIQLKTYEQLQYEIIQLNTDKYLLQQENKQLKEELQKADSITQSCIFEGKEESTINFRECLNKLELYKEVIEEINELVKRELFFSINPKTKEREMVLVLDKVQLSYLLQILDKVKD